MKNNIKKYTIFSLVCALLFGSFTSVFAVKNNQEIKSYVSNAEPVVEVISFSQTQTVKVSVTDSVMDCSSFESGNLQGSVVNLNLPATCFKLVNKNLSPIYASVRVINLTNNSVVKVVSKNAAVSEPSYQKSGQANLPSLPSASNELLFGVLILGLVVKLSYGKKVFNFKILFETFNFNRFHVLRC